MKLRTISITFALLVTGTAIFGQRGLSVGPSLTFGQVFSRNVILSDTSKYYVKNAPGMFGSGGVDVIFGFDDHFSLHAGGAFNMKEFKLQPENTETGAAINELVTRKTYISIPMAIHYRLPLKKGGHTFINFMAGHTLDMVKRDSTVTNTPNTVVDSGGSLSSRWVMYDKRNLPTVILGVGLNVVSAKNHTLDISLVWGIGTGKMVRGDIKEWSSLNKQFIPDGVKLPDQFPSFYFDYAMRGSYLSLRLSYWFNTGILSVKKDHTKPVDNPQLPELRDPSDPDDQ